MTSLLDMIKNMHTILGYHTRTDSWKPSICYLNAYTPIPKSVKPTLNAGCDCMITCKFYPKEYPPGMMYYS